MAAFVADRGRFPRRVQLDPAGIYTTSSFFGSTAWPRPDLIPRTNNGVSSPSYLDFEFIVTRGERPLYRFSAPSVLPRLI